MTISWAPLRDLLFICCSLPQQFIDLDWVWYFYVHPRVRLFIWKLAWDVLPTCFLLSRRGLSIQPTCPLCGFEMEMSDHAIFHCARARQIWQISGACPWDFGTDVHRISFLRLMKQDTGRGSNQRGPLWAYIAYQIWLSRYRILFSDMMVPSGRVVRSAFSLSAEYALHHGSPDSANPGLWVSPAASAANRRTVFISWEPPPLGFVKINFDGSVRGRCAGAAFVIRGANGRMLAAGGLGLLDLSVPLAELHAAWIGISYAIRSLGARSIIIEGDSITVVRWIRQEPSSLLPSIPLMYDIRSTISEARHVHIRHIYREANAVADWIAGCVASHSGVWSWKQGDPCPSILTQLLYGDMSGVTYPRML